MNKILLVLHGFPGLAMNDPIRKFARVNGYNAVIPDLFSDKVEFTIQSLSKYIEKLLHGRKPDVIIASSMGGLIAPIIARKYPKTVLILIATAPNLRIGIKVYNYLIHNINLKIIKLLGILFQFFPFGIYRMLFLIFNPNLSQKQERYEEDIRETFRMLKKISPDKLAEVAKFAREADTSEDLKTLNNKTLILTGGFDKLMPKEKSVQLSHLIRNNMTVINEDRLHYEVFDERDFAVVANFVNS